MSHVGVFEEAPGLSTVVQAAWPVQLKTTAEDFHWFTVSHHSEHFNY